MWNPPPSLTPPPLKGPRTRVYWLFLLSIAQKQGDHPNLRKNVLGVKRPFSELSESSEGPKIEKIQSRDASRVYGKGGLGLRGVAFMTVLTVLAVLESTLPSCSFSYKIQHNEATVAVLTVSAVVTVAVVTATPLKPNPPFS